MDKVTAPSLPPLTDECDAPSTSSPTQSEDESEQSALGRRRSFLLPHVYTCIVDEGIMFLDARKNRYSSLSKRYLQLLESTLGGLGTSCYPPTHDARDSEHLTATLESQGLITRDPTLGKAYAPVSLPPIDIACSYDIPFRRPSVELSDTMRFCVACLKAVLVLRLCSMEWILRDQSRARDRASSKITEADTESTLDIAARFRLLRRFFFSSKDRCLFSALALAYFMRAYGHFPMFVIGIRSAPFRPHCWVQRGAVAFDNRPDRLGRYTPILAI